jgi:hypothetical protein
MLFYEMFLKLNFTKKYIWGKILYFFQESHGTLLLMQMRHLAPDEIKTLLNNCMALSLSLQDEKVSDQLLAERFFIN